MRMRIDIVFAERFDMCRGIKSMLRLTMKTDLLFLLFFDKASVTFLNEVLRERQRLNSIWRLHGTRTSRYV